MEYIHIRNLEKFHPGYKDRQLLWAKIHFAIVQGDPEFELIDNEIDKWRFVAMICLELRAQKPLPNLDSYWQKQGFNLKKRPMSLTLKMLHNFVTLDTLGRESCTPEESRVEESRVEEIVSERDFETTWKDYPNRVGKKNALRHFTASVKTLADFENFKKAMANYLQSGNVARGFIKNGSTWFNEWQDWTDPTPEMMRGNVSERDQSRSPSVLPLKPKKKNKCEIHKLEHDGPLCPKCFVEV